MQLYTGPICAHTWYNHIYMRLAADQMYTAINKKIHVCHLRIK